MSDTEFIARPAPPGDPSFEQVAARHAGAATLAAWRDTLVAEHGIGTRAVVYVDNTLPHAALLFFLLAHGISPLVLPADSTADEARGYAREIGADSLWRLADGQSLTIERIAAAPALSGDNPPESGLHLLTSGSTGRPAVVFRPVASWRHEARRYIDLLGLAPEHHVLLVAPVYHAYVLGWLWAAADAGCALEICAPTQLGRTVDALRQRATHCALTPFIASLLARRAGSGARPARLRVAMAGAGPVDAPLDAQFQAAFGLGLSRNYGSTETGAMFAGIAPLPPLCIGRPMPGLRIAARPGDASAFPLVIELEDGRLHPTGDLVSEGEHGYQIVGRETAAIRRGEAWISPFEIEAVLRECPLVDDCQVRSVKSRRGDGNDHILASIVPRPGLAWDSGAVRRFCRERLRENKVPDVFEAVDAIRRTANGKAARSPVYRWAAPERLIEAAGAYKRSALLFALCGSGVLERLDGVANVDQLAYESGLHADALGELLSVAAQCGLLSDAPDGAPAPLPDAVADLVRLEADAAGSWNRAEDLRAILQAGRRARPLATHAPSPAFIARYQRAMNGPHKQRAALLAMRRLAALHPGPYRVLDVSATSGAYSARLAAQGLVRDGRCVLVGGLNAEPAPGVRCCTLADACAGAGDLDVVILDNAVHHPDVASNLLRLTERLSTAGVVVVDELFLGDGAGAAIGVDWITHGGTCHPTESSIDLLMLNLGFRKQDVMKDDATVSHRVNFYSRT
ncbi:hypothetical protein WL10_17335 [Burkholderia ubonensis]|uniref:class I adenylate-forming enzyme family protein n=1 Tax=Burkholderia ubonensis TaxID=101571 RepID=UPI0007609E4E|nr:fatty acid--CoA ligase family protein [Burkholderia ubonensis]KVX88420.1 hypothetical protein WL10_17335 [Burkholderia ubonensis]